MHDYKGAIHIHSNYSYDGNVSVKTIIESAKRAGLDFIVITDHHTIQAKKDGYEGWHNNCLLIVGEEISPRFNHYLAFNIKENIAVDKEESQPQKYIDEVNKQGGFGIITHPDHIGATKFGMRSYRWQDWNVKGFIGVSIWDLMTDWQETLSNYPKAFYAYFFPSNVLTGPKKETLKKWDSLNNNSSETCRKVVGIGEIDNHDKYRKELGFYFRIFPFDYAFKTIRTHILLKEPFIKNAITDIEKIFTAIKNGNVYVSNDFWIDATDFEFTIKDKNKTAYIGEEFKLNGSAVINVKLKTKALVKLIKDGNIIFKIFDSEFSYQINEKGIYRVEVYLKRVFKLHPWIFSNPIFVK